MLKFTPEFNLGHVIMVVTLVGSLTIPTVSGFFSMRAEVEKVRTDAQAAIAQHELRITAIEHSQEQARQEMRESLTDLRTWTAKTSDVLNDLKVQLAPLLVRPTPPHKG